MSDNTEVTWPRSIMNAEIKAWVSEKLEAIDAARVGRGLRMCFLQVEAEVLKEGLEKFPLCDRVALREEFHKLLACALLNTEEKTRTFQNVRCSDVARLLATEAGYGLEAQHIEDMGTIHPSLHQERMTDAQFLRKLADKEGFRFYVDVEGFHFRSYREGESQEVPKVAMGLESA